MPVGHDAVVHRVRHEDLHRAEDGGAGDAAGRGRVEQVVLAARREVKPPPGLLRQRWLDVDDLIDAVAERERGVVGVQGALHLLDGGPHAVGAILVDDVRLRRPAAAGTRSVSVVSARVSTWEGRTAAVPGSQAATRQRPGVRGSSSAQLFQNASGGAALTVAGCGR